MNAKHAARATGSEPASPEGLLPHLAGIGASVRMVAAAHFLRDCPHVLEIGGHLQPITSYLTHAPVSVTSVDPKTRAFESESLNGRPCRVRHIAAKFQEISYSCASGSYGLVLLGYSLKPFGRKDPLGDLLFSLIDNARTVIIDYAPELERAASQVPRIIARPTLRVRTMFDMVLHDPEISGTPYAARTFLVLDTQHRAS